MKHMRLDVGLARRGLFVLALWGCSSTSELGSGDAGVSAGGMGGAAGGGSNSSVPAEATLNGEEQVVYRAVLAQHYPASFYVIEAETGTSIGGSDPVDQELSYVGKACPSLSAEVASSFRTRNAAQDPVAADMNLGAPYVVLSDQQINQIFSGGDCWDTFYAQYPDAHGIIQLSRVGFSATLDQALVYVGAMYGDLAGAGYYYLLQKDDSGWTVSCQQMTWIS
jgi:hypothetical protein